MKVASRESWLEQRNALLLEEKALTKRRADLAAKRRDLPWVRLDKGYVFQSPEGPVPMSDLFEGCSQLLIYHLMFGAGWSKPCVGCTSWANAFQGTIDQVRNADANLIAVSRAPIEQFAPVQNRLGWTFTWVSSAESDYGLDFFASSEDLSPESSKVMPGGERVFFDRGENHGVSVFAKDESGAIYHTYSAHNRGIEELNGAMGYCDLLPGGRTW